MVSCNFRVEDYDPLTIAQKVAQGLDPSINLFAEAIGGTDYDDQVVGTLEWTSADSQIEKTIEVAVLANPETEETERFQIRLSGFGNVKPLKPVGICAITDRVLPLLRVQDVTEATSRISRENPNIAARTITVPISISQASTEDINFTFTTFDGTARAGSDYLASAGSGVIKAGSTTPENPVTVRIPTQLLEATETFGLRVLNADPTARYIAVKSEATITLTGRALKPTYYPVPINYDGRVDRARRSVTQEIRCIPAPTAASGPLVVNWVTTNTYTGEGPGARVGWHFRASRGSFTFNVGESVKSVSIPIGDWLWRYSLDPDDEAWRRNEFVSINIVYTLQSGDGEPSTVEGNIGLQGYPTGTLIPGQNLVTIGSDFTVVEGERAIVPVTLATSPPGDRQARIRYTTTSHGIGDRAAIVGTHYRLTTGTVTWPALTTRLARSVIVQTLRSQVPPDVRRFRVVFSHAQNCVFSGNAATDDVAITITDTGTTGTILTGEDESVVEPAPGVIQTEFVSFTLSGATIAGQRYVVSVAPQEVTALAGRHYVRPTGPTGGRTDMVFTPTYAGEPVEVQYPVRIIGGTNITRAVYFDIYVGANRVSGGVQTPAGITLQSEIYRFTIRPRATTGTGTLPAVNVTDQTVDETAGQISIPLTLTSAAPANCSVNFQTVDNTGKANTDYVPASDTVRFGQGGTTGSISMNVLANTGSTDDKRFQIRLSSYRSCVPGNSRTINVTVRNTDAVRPPPQPDQPPSINLLGGSINVPATGTALGRFTISTSRPLSTPITGTISTRNGTGSGGARAGTHFTGLTNQVWTIRAGTTTVEVPVTILAATLTADLTFTATIALTSTNANLDTSTATFTITRVEEETSVSVQDLDLTDAATTRASVVIQREGNPQPFTLRVSTVDGQNARSGIRYRAISNRLIRFRQGQVSTTVTIDINRPTGRVARGQFILRASSLSVGTLTKADGTITLPAYEPVVVTTPYITLSSGQQTEPSSGAVNMEFTVSSSKVWSTAISGSYITRRGTAIPGNDYGTAGSTREVAGTWTIPVGQRTTTINIPVLADVVDDINETFTVRIGIDTGNARFRQQQTSLTATGTIINRRQSTSSLSIGDITAAERGTEIRVPVTRTGATATEASFEASTVSTNSATAGVDYDTVTRQRIRMSPGVTSAFVPVQTHLRGSQPAETFGVRIHNPSPGVTIADDRANVELPAVGRTPIILAPPGIFVGFHADVLSTYGTLMATCPVVLALPVDTDVTGRYTITLTAEAYVPAIPTPGRPQRLVQQFGTSGSGTWRIPAGGNFAIFPAISQQRRTGNSRWLNAVATGLLAAIGLATTGAVGFFATLSAYPSAALSLSVVALQQVVIFTTVAGTIAFPFTGGGAPNTDAFNQSLSQNVGAAMVATDRAASGDLVALGNDVGVTGAELLSFKRAFGADRITATITISSVRGPALAPLSLIARTVIE